MSPSLALALLVACSSPEEPRVLHEGPPSTRNALVVLVDTLRADHLGAYGYPRPTSPHLDALAADGALFPTTWAPSPWTYASAASLMTGLTPAAHGAIMPGPTRDSAPDALQRLHDGYVTLAEVAQAAGVKTALITRNRYLGFGVEQGFGHYENEEGRVAKVQTDRALAWLDTLDADDRFLLVVHYMDVHAPNNSRPESRAVFLPEPLTTEERHHAGVWRRRYAVPDPQGVPGFEVYREHRTALYDASIHYVDHQVARLVDGLGGRRRDTLVVFTADHGEEFWEHAALEASLYSDRRDQVGVGHGHTLFEELVRIPLVLHQPGVVPRGVVPGRASLLDVRSTITELMALPDDTPQEGRSLVPALRGEPLAQDRTLVLDSVCYGRDKAALLQGTDKLTRSWGEPSLLVDLSADPGEQTDLTGERPDQAAALTAELEARLARSSALGAQLRGGEATEVQGYDEDDRSALEALGYLDP